jgi:hypothetical protein
MFQFPGLASLEVQTLLRTGYPIRKSPDQSLLPAPRGLSQVATSFFASLCQGIHHMPFVTYRISFGLLSQTSHEFFMTR